jgi:protoporphyrinogen/coproporphyrinogen III oxidase
MKRIAIAGGGISGLAAAYELEKRRQAGAKLAYVLYEAGTRWGGVLRTEVVDGCVIEAGPDSFLTEKSWTADLCREIGLGEQLIGSKDGERKTYILVNGRLTEMPDGLMFLVPTKVLPIAASSLFSLSTKTRMAGEWFFKPRTASNEDESVAAFVERHYGKEMVERLADPLLSGIYGGEAADLSVRAVLPRFVQMETKYGSLGKALLAGRKKNERRSTAPIFTSLQGGMQQLADALAACLGSDSLRLNSTVTGVQPEGGGWRVAQSSGAESFDAVILAASAPGAGSLLRSTNPELAAELEGIVYTSSVVVALGYDEKVRASLPAGFGFLVPRTEGKRMLAATFVHNKFAFRAPPDRALIRCFLGGSHNEQTLTLSDDEVVGLARSELRQILKLDAPPLFSRVYRWKKAMAQYGVGHLEKLGRIAAYAAKSPTLALAGNAYRGIGVPDCLRSGSEAAQQVAAALGISN